MIDYAALAADLYDEDVLPYGLITEIDALAGESEAAQAS